MQFHRQCSYVVASTCQLAGRSVGRRSAAQLSGTDGRQDVRASLLHRLTSDTDQLSTEARQAYLAALEKNPDIKVGYRPSLLHNNHATESENITYTSKSILKDCFTLSGRGVFHNAHTAHWYVVDAVDQSAQPSVECSPQRRVFFVDKHLLGIQILPKPSSADESATGREVCLHNVQVPVEYSAILPASANGAHTE